MRIARRARDRCFRWRSRGIFVHVERADQHRAIGLSRRTSAASRTAAERDDRSANRRWSAAPRRQRGSSPRRHARKRPGIAPLPPAPRPAPPLPASARSSVTAVKALMGPSPAAILASSASTVSVALRSPLAHRRGKRAQAFVGAHEPHPSSGVKTAAATVSSGSGTPSKARRRAPAPRKRRDLRRDPRARAAIRSSPQPRARIAWGRRLRPRLFGLSDHTIDVPVEIPHLVAAPGFALLDRTTPVLSMIGPVKGLKPLATLSAAAATAACVASGDTAGRTARSRSSSPRPSRTMAGLKFPAITLFAVSVMNGPQVKPRPVIQPLGASARASIDWKPIDRTPRLSRPG